MVCVELNCPQFSEYDRNHVLHTAPWGVKMGHLLLRPKKPLRNLKFTGITLLSVFWMIFEKIKKIFKKISKKKFQKGTPVLVCMVFVYCVLCIIVYCAEKFWDLYTKMRDSVILRPEFTIPWSEHFGWFCPLKTWIFTNRIPEISPYFVVWKIYYKTQFSRTLPKLFSALKHSKNARKVQKRA